MEAVHTKDPIKITFSAKNFDTIIGNNSSPAGDRSSRQRTSCQDEAMQSSGTTKAQGKNYGSNHLKQYNKDKTLTTAQFAPVSAVRSLNSPIHQITNSIPSRSVSEVDSSYPLPLNPPPPPVIPLLSHLNKTNDSASSSISNQIVHKEAEYEGYHSDRKNLFGREGEGLVLDEEEELSCHIGLLSSNISSDRADSSIQCRTNEKVNNLSKTTDFRTNEGLAQSLKIRSVDSAPQQTNLDIKANSDRCKNFLDSVDYKGAGQEEKVKGEWGNSFPALSALSEKACKEEQGSSGVPGIDTDNTIVHASEPCSAQIQSSSNADIITTNTSSVGSKTVMSETSHDNSVNFIEEKISEKQL